MKRSYSLLAVLMIATVALAVPAKRGVWRTITLKDGSTVKVELRGDEYFHYFQSSDGSTYVADNVSNYKVVGLDELREQIKERRMAKTKGAMKSPAAASAPAKVSSTYTGKKKGLIILAQFEDMKFQTKDDKAYYERVANEENFSDGDFVGSVHDYFYAQSNGKFDLTFDVAGPYTMAHKVAYYGANDSEGNDTNAAQLIYDACLAARDDVDFSQYDWDDDGYVDQVYVIYAGCGEADGGGDDTIWPHRWYIRYGVGRTLTLDGKIVNSYACSAELSYSTGEIGGMGTICHEFSHCLGLPDLYDTEYSGNYGMANWSLMDYGSYNGNGFRPCNYTAYERMAVGWQDPIELKDEEVTVSDMKSLSDNGNTYIIYNQGNANEYYLLENRQQTGWDLALYNSGMLITHVDYNSSAWSGNVVNNTKGHERCAVVAADNSYGNTSKDIGNDLYPYSSNNSLTNKTTPAASVFNVNSDGTYFLNRAVTDITQYVEGKIGFKYNPSSVEGTASQYLFSETFDKCRGKGGNDDNGFSGNVASSTFNPDNSGWVANTKYGAYQCARFGTSSKAGSATTPNFTINGSATLTFKAAAWDSNNEQRTLTITLPEGFQITDDSGYSSQKTACTMQRGEWTSYTYPITGTGEMNITFSSEGRFFLDEIVADGPKATGIQSIYSKMERVVDNRIYNMNGQYMGTNLDSLPHGMYIQNHKKIIK